MSFRTLIHVFVYMLYLYQSVTKFIMYYYMYDMYQCVLLLMLYNIIYIFFIYIYI
jgi:hypothetical protein